jgi:predicted GTPase
VVDINNPSTFYNLDEWMEHYKKHLPSTPVYLACNKIDENVDLDCSDYFEQIACNKIFFTSAKDNFKVKELFETICYDMMNAKPHHRIKVY